MDDIKDTHGLEQPTDPRLPAVRSQSSEAISQRQVSPSQNLQDSPTQNPWGNPQPPILPFLPNTLLPMIGQDPSEPGRPFDSEVQNRPLPRPSSPISSMRRIAGQYITDPKLHLSEQSHTVYLNASIEIQQYKDYVKLRIQYSSTKASRQRIMHTILQIIILVGAALVSISLGFPPIPSWLPPIISGMVTIAAAIANYFKFGERSRDLYRNAEDMQQEYNRFKSKRGAYKNLNELDSIESFQDGIDTLKREQFLRSFSFEGQKETQNNFPLGNFLVLLFTIYYFLQ